MTAQIHENLILDGERTSMAFCPPLPENHPRIVGVGFEEAIRSSRWVFSTACWRNYVGTWEIRGGRFYLVSLGGTRKLLGSEPLLANWFSGVLRIPRGEVLLYVHMGFGSVFEEELHVRVYKGSVLKSRVIDNRRKRHDEGSLSWNNYPGSYNRFPGDDDVYW